MTEFAERIKNLPLGAVYLISMGQAGYIIRSKNGNLLGIDLYLSNYSQRAAGNIIAFKRLLPELITPNDLLFDALVATHNHSDHFDNDSMQDLMKNGTTRLYASVECKNKCEELHIDRSRCVYVKPGDNYVECDFNILFINCDHGTGAPDAVGVIIEVDGYTILEVGDTCLRLDRKDEYLLKGNPDILIAPINGAYGNMNEKECAELSKLLSPALTIPCHFGMFAAAGGNPNTFIEEMKKQCPYNKYNIMALGECLQLN